MLGLDEGIVVRLLVAIFYGYAKFKPWGSQEAEVLIELTILTSGRWQCLNS
jgi:hypothetical protein